MAEKVVVGEWKWQSDESEREISSDTWRDSGKERGEDITKKKTYFYKQQEEKRQDLLKDTN